MIPGGSGQPLTIRTEFEVIDLSGMGFELHPISIGWIVSVRLLLAKMFSFGLGQYGVNRPAQELHHVGLEAAFPIRR